MSAPSTTRSALSFAALDVETANRARGSICAIGVTIVIDARIVDTRTWVCRPPAGVDTFEPMQIRTHGITADQVAGEPRFEQIWPAVAQFIGDLPLVAQNRSFDVSALRQACALSNLPLPQLETGCTMLWSRALHPELPNHKLPTLSTFFGVELRHHHDAGEDARACAQILIAMNHAAGSHHSLAELAAHAGRPLEPLSTDGLPVTGLSDAAPGRRIGTLPLTGTTAAGILSGRSAVLVSRMTTLTRATATALAAQFGATVTNQVTDSTDLLILGSRASTTADAQRLHTARLARTAGRRIDVLTELEFLKITSTFQTRPDCRGSSFNRAHTAHPS